MDDKPQDAPSGSRIRVKRQGEPWTVDTGEIRQFSTGATRDTGEGKLCYEGFESPAVMRRFAEYMHEHRRQSDGTLRDADNWQKGIPIAAYQDSLVRHVMDAWLLWRSGALTPKWREELIELLCAIRFNVNGLMFELLREEP